MRWVGKMKTNTTTRWVRAALSLLAVLSTSAQAVDVPVTWNVATATCVVSTTPSEILALGEVDVSGILGASAPSFKTVGGIPFSIDISGCNDGISIGSGVRPSVNVTGAGGPVVTPGYANKWLFKSGGDSEGVYIVLVKGSKSDGSDPNNIEVGDNTWLYVPGYGTDSIIPASVTPSIHLTAAVACGNPGQGTPKMCRKETTRAGDLRASFTFAFQYH